MRGKKKFPGTGFPKALIPPPTSFEEPNTNKEKPKILQLIN